MRVMGQRLSPRVQDGEEADGGAEVFRVGGNGAQRLGGGPEEDPVDDRFIPQRDLGDRLGTVKTTWKYSVSSRSAVRASIQAARASDWHVGQCRFRQVMECTPLVVLWEVVVNGECEPVTRSIPTSISVSDSPLKLWLMCA